MVVSASVARETRLEENKRNEVAIILHFTTDN